LAISLSLGSLALVLAVLAADRKRQRAQPAAGNLAHARGARAIRSRVEPGERRVDQRSRLGLHPGQGRLDVTLTAGAAVFGIPAATEQDLPEG
jgi:hypothetical protein